ncbi:hypothetical protein E2C01_070142 [Portunus trituberculatus]|uniref:Uncharacterized protein n=1 Tax=Portunus trituberculatus TaxID=210409 RepID=A0A5B7I4C8_PORTR|nr:hypothetical protein [Portunus trituberculatus]
MIKEKMEIKKMLDQRGEDGWGVRVAVMRNGVAELAEVEVASTRCACGRKYLKKNGRQGFA